MHQGQDRAPSSCTVSNHGFASVSLGGCKSSAEQAAKSERVMQVSDLLAQYGHGTGAHRQETGPSLSGQGMTAEQSLGRSFHPASPGSALQGSMPPGLGLQSQPNSTVHSGSGGISPRTGTSITTATGSKERLLQRSSAGFSDSPDVSTPWPTAPQPRTDRGHDDDTPPSTVSCLCLCYGGHFRGWGWRWRSPSRRQGVAIVGESLLASHCAICSPMFRLCQTHVIIVNTGGVFQRGVVFSGKTSKTVN
jgi:hypothetical protein